MGKRRSEHRHVSTVSWRRVNGRALRLAAFSFLLPVPVALAAPHSSSMPSEHLVAMSQVPVNGVGDTVLPRVLPVEALKAANPEGDPTASLTHVRGKENKTVSASAIAENGIPAAALRAYRAAEATMGLADPSCNLTWGLLAGIGRVESDHGRYGGAVLGRDGVSSPEILGLPLNGVGPVAAIADTDNGSLDGDRRWDRAVGPMQFIPSTWAIVGVDGDTDGKRNPHDIDDAALAAAAYLCAGEGDLSTPRGVHDAVFSYNHSEEYVALVVGVAKAYESGIVDLPVLSAPVAPGPGVEVGLGNPGDGVMIGASDEVNNPRKGTKARGKENGKENRAAPTGKENGKEDVAGPTGRTRGTVDRTGDDTTTKPKKRTGGNSGNSGEGSDDSTDESTTPPAKGGQGGDGSGDGDSSGDESKDEVGEDVGDDVESSPTPTPDPEPVDEVTPLGTGTLTGSVQEPVLVVDGTEIPLTPGTEVDASWIDNPDVIVTVQRTTTTVGGETVSVVDVVDQEEGKED